MATSGQMSDVSSATGGSRIVQSVTPLCRTCFSLSSRAVPGRTANLAKPSGELRSPLEFGHFVGQTSVRSGLQPFTCTSPDMLANESAQTQGEQAEAGVVDLESTAGFGPPLGELRSPLDKLKHVLPSAAGAWGY